MNNRRGLLFYLFLNILVSVCVTLAVLTLWDRARSLSSPGAIAPLINFGSSNRPTASATAPLDTPTPAPSPTPAIVLYQVQSGDTFESIAAAYGVSVALLLEANGFKENQLLGTGEVLRIPVPQVTIESVVGVGDLALEHVVIRSLVDEQLSLAGWLLDDGSGNVYRFPQVNLFTRDGVINIYTKEGADSVTDLYWNLKQSLWESGNVATLRDASGEIAATYTLP